MKKVSLGITLLLLLPALFNGLPAMADFGDEDVDVDPSFGVVGDDIDITATDFPASTTISFYLKATLLGSNRSNSAGTAVLTTTVPEAPGGTHLVLAKAESVGAVSSTPFTVEPDLLLYDEANRLIEDDDHLGNGSKIRIVGTGFLAFEEVDLLDDGEGGVEESIVTRGLVTKMAKGTLGEDRIAATAKGSFDLTYTLIIDEDVVDTDDFITVRADGLGNGIDDGTGVLTVDFLAVGAITIDLAGKDTGEKDDEIDINIAAVFEGLVDEQKYSLLFDDSLLTLKFDSTTSTWFTTANGTITFEVPRVSSGVHSLSVVKQGTRTGLASAAFVVSIPGGSAGITVVNTERDIPQGKAISSAIVGQKVAIALYNFEDTESGVDVSMETPFGLESPAVTIGESGADVVTFDIPSMPSGSYLVFVDRTEGSEPTLQLTVRPSLTIVAPDPARGPPGTEITIQARGFDPNTLYRIMWNPTTSKTVQANVAFNTDNEGEEEDVTFEVPIMADGKYTFTLVPAESPTQAVAVYGPLGGVEYPTFEFDSDMTFLPDTSFVANELVRFSWDSGDAAGDGQEAVEITVDGTPILSGLINSTFFAGTSSAVSVIWSGTLLNGTFIMPNGAADAEVEVRITLGGSSTGAVIERKAGAGSLLIGADITGDIASIKASLGQLSILDAKITSINNGIVSIQTSLGTISTDLSAIGADVVSVDEGVATLRTRIGVLQADIDDLDAFLRTDLGRNITVLSSLVRSTANSVDTIRTLVQSGLLTLESVKKTAESTKGDLDATSSTVIDISSDLGTLTESLSRGVTNIRGDLTSVSGTVGTVSTMQLIQLAISALAVALIGLAMMVLRRR